VIAGRDGGFTRAFLQERLQPRVFLKLAASLRRRTGTTASWRRRGMKTAFRFDMAVDARLMKQEPAAEAAPARAMGTADDDALDS
jgi:hypothetical protein